MATCIKNKIPRFRNLFLAHSPTSVCQSVSVVGQGRDVPSWQGLGFVPFRHRESLGKFAAHGLGFFSPGEEWVRDCKDRFFLIILRRGTRENTAESCIHRTSWKRERKKIVCGPEYIGGSGRGPAHSTLPPSPSYQGGSRWKIFRSTTLSDTGSCSFSLLECALWLIFAALKVLIGLGGRRPRYKRKPSPILFLLLLFLFSLLEPMPPHRVSCSRVKYLIFPLGKGCDTNTRTW